jgi:hypothetical protein
MTNLIRLRIYDLQRSGLLEPETKGLVRFNDGSTALVTCLSEKKIMVDYKNMISTLDIVRHARRNAGTRTYFFVDNCRVMDVYFHTTLGFTSRHAADLRFSSENLADPSPIPRRRSSEYGRFEIEVMR